MEKLDLKKIGAKHIRDAERLDYLVKRGLNKIEISLGKYTATVDYHYKTGSGTETFTGDTMCECLEKAWAVFGNDPKPTPADGDE